MGNGTNEPLFLWDQNITDTYTVLPTNLYVDSGLTGYDYGTVLGKLNQNDADIDAVLTGTLLNGDVVITQVGSKSMNIPASVSINFPSSSYNTNPKISALTPGQPIYITIKLARTDHLGGAYILNGRVWVGPSGIQTPA